MIILDLHPVDVLISLINILVLFTLLRLILWKPVNRYLTARTERVRQEFEKADKANQEAQALIGEYSKNLDKVEEQGREMIRESRIKATEEADEILKEAQDKAGDMVREARKRIAEERERAVVDARVEIAQLATDMAARILKREVSLGDSASAVDDFFQEAGQ